MTLKNILTQIVNDLEHFSVYSASVQKLVLSTVRYEAGQLRTVRSATEQDLRPHFDNLRASILALPDVPLGNDDATVLATKELLPGPSDRRRHPRYRLSCPIEIRCADGTVSPGMSLEVSQTGMSVVTGACLRVGETVELKPSVFGKTLALVRRTSGRLSAFEFLCLSKDQTQRLVDLCGTLPQYHPNTLDIGLV